jgi:hypothetical protein
VATWQSGWVRGMMGGWQAGSVGGRLGAGAGDAGAAARLNVTACGGDDAYGGGHLVLVWQVWRVPAKVATAAVAPGAWPACAAATACLVCLPVGVPCAPGCGVAICLSAIVCPFCVSLSPCLPPSPRCVPPYATMPACLLCLRLQGPPPGCGPSWLSSCWTWTGPETSTRWVGCRVGHWLTSIKAS